MKKHLILGWLICGLSVLSNAGIVTFTDTIRGQGIAANKKIDLQDDRYGYMLANPSTWPNEFTNYNVTDKVTLKFTDALKTYYNANWDFTVNFTLDRWDATGASLTQQTCTLKVSY